MKTTIIGLLALLVAGSSQAAMQALNDTELDAVQGQALITAGYTSSGNIGFYKVGLQANLEINANIRKLQLGCGGINGAGCDIDIDNFSLSGNCANRPSCDAVMKNPFIEFAVKNPGNSSQREIAGFRLSSELMTGLISAGINDGTANGINTFSGYMNIAPTTGTGTTKPGSFTNTITGRANIGGCIAGCPAYFTTRNESLSIPSVTTTLNYPSVTVNGTGLQSVNLTASANIPDIPISDSSGYRSAQISGCFVVAILPLCNYNISQIYINGAIHGLKTNVSVSEKLGYIHNIPLNSPFSISLQKESISWPGQPVAAQRGWWMSISDPVQLGDLSPAQKIDISPTYGQVASILSNYLYNNPVYVDFGQAVGSVFGQPIHTYPGSMDVSGNIVTMALSNLALGSAQNVTPNCWGTSKFC